MNLSTHVLLTGGTGFFGRALLRRWLADSKAGRNCPKVSILTRSEISFLDRYPEFSGLPWLDFCVGDILIPETLPSGIAFSHILHAAGDPTQSSLLSPLRHYDQIVSGTRNLLDLAVECGAQRFLFISSGAAYGQQPENLEKFSEDWHGMPDPLVADNSYGIAKRTTEHLCTLYAHAHGLNIVVARCFSFIGPDLPPNAHFAIGNFIRDALSRTEIVVNGDGTPLRTYLDQSDLAHWLLTLLEKGISGRAYNVGSDQAISISDLAYLIRDTIAPQKTVQISRAIRPDGVRSRYIPDIHRAQSELGLKITISLRTAIRETASAYLARELV